MATDRPGNKDVPPRNEDDHVDGLVTYEQPDASGAAVERGGSAHTAKASWMRHWPVLLLAAGGLLTLWSMWTWASRVNTPDADQRLEMAAEHMESGDLHLMQQHLDAFAGSWLQEATPVQQASYYMMAGDWISLWQHANGVDEPENARKIVRNYEQAESLGGWLDDVRLERWAMACLGAETPMAASGFLDRLSSLDPEQFPLAARRHDRIHRAWIRAVMVDPAQHDLDILAALRAFREADGITIDDRAWSAARMAEYRLEQGRNDEAVRMLHVDLRRLEAAREGAAPKDAVRGELMVLLGRGYRALGQWDEASNAVQQALDVCAPTDPVRGEAWVLLGQMRSASGDLEGAFECHDNAISELPATESNLPALIGRGEIRSLLGDHEASLSDLAEAGRLLRAGRTHQDVDVMMLTAVYMDRYEAVLLQGWLDHALAYAAAAESLHEPEDCPGEVSHAVATAAGQRAMNLESLLPEELASPFQSRDEDTRSLRKKIASLHVKAAESHRAAARWWRDQPGEESRWRTSLVEAGRHDDAAGRTVEAIEAFTEALAATSEDDPRRGDLMKRLGRCLQAEGRFDEAATWYTLVIETWPSSPDATRCHVPLARCLEAMGEIDAAWAGLLEVVQGRTVLTPGAVDWMAALKEMGTLGFRSGRYAEAIPHLDACLARTVDPDERIEQLLLLAGCTRGAARDLTRRLVEDSTLAPSMRDVLDAKRRALLERSWQAYDEVVAFCEQMPPLDPRRGNGTLRTALIGLGDAQYDLGEYQRAIGTYERTARDFADHTASMHALVQIAGAWVELGDRERASAAHERALQRLETMPDDALSRIDSLMDREIWERWMRIMPVGAQVVSAEDG